MPDFPVTLYRPDQVVRTVTDKNGRFVFAGLPPGTYDLEAGYSHFDRQVFGIRVNTADVNIGFVALIFDQDYCGETVAPRYIPDGKSGGRVLGTLTLYPDIPIPSKKLTQARITLHAVGGTTRRITVRPNHKGDFEFRNVPPGRYLLRAERRGYLKSEVALWVARKDVTQVEIELRKHGHPMICQ